MNMCITKSAPHTNPDHAALRAYVKANTAGWQKVLAHTPWGLVPLALMDPPDAAGNHRDGYLRGRYLNRAGEVVHTTTRCVHPPADYTVLAYASADALEPLADMATAALGVVCGWRGPVLVARYFDRIQEG